jgi:DNA-binding response OmpR family regulator
MPATVLLSLRDREIIKTLSAYLESEKFKIAEGPLPDQEILPSQAAGGLVESRPDLVILDYLPEDAWSVKVMQASCDIAPKTSFILVDSDGLATREGIMMAFNEGAKAFVPRDISKVAFLTYIGRALERAGRVRVYDRADEQALQDLGERLATAENRLAASRKLIAYLLSASVSAQPRKALILSDSSYQREMLKKHLEDSNFEVLSAGTAEEAINRTLSEKPRVLISDYDLEDGKTGVDVCRALKFQHKFMPLYFIICTASQDKISTAMTPGNGVDDCLLKPSSDSSINDFLSRVAMGLII